MSIREILTIGTSAGSAGSAHAQQIRSEVCNYLVVRASSIGEIGKCSISVDFTTGANRSVVCRQVPLAFFADLQAIEGGASWRNAMLVEATEATAQTQLTRLPFSVRIPIGHAILTGSDTLDVTLHVDSAFVGTENVSVLTMHTGEQPYERVRRYEFSADNGGAYADVEAAFLYRPLIASPADEVSGLDDSKLQLGLVLEGGGRPHFGGRALAGAYFALSEQDYSQHATQVCPIHYNGEG